MIDPFSLYAENPERAAGRGRAVIAAVGTRWGHYRTPDGWKVVWCELLDPAREGHRERDHPAAARPVASDGFCRP